MVSQCLSVSYQTTINESSIFVQLIPDPSSHTSSADGKGAGEGYALNPSERERSDVLGESPGIIGRYRNVGTSLAASTTRVTGSQHGIFGHVVRDELGELHHHTACRSLDHTT